MSELTYRLNPNNDKIVECGIDGEWYAVHTYASSDTAMWRVEAELAKEAALGLVHENTLLQTRLGVYQETNASYQSISAQAIQRMKAAEATCDKIVAEASDRVRVAEVEMQRLRLERAELIGKLPNREQTLMTRIMSLEQANTQLRGKNHDLEQEVAKQTSKAETTMESAQILSAQIERLSAILYDMGYVEDEGEVDADEGGNDATAP